jgi:hypothetical protein
MSVLIGCLAACGGKSSMSVGVPVVTNPNPIPAVTLLNPTFMGAGGPTFVLSVNGSGFIGTSQVQWNGVSRATTLVSSTELQAQITAEDIATTGTASVTVFNPAPGGGTSGALTFKISTPFTMTTLSQTANDLIWDPVHQVIYLSVPGSATANGNTIAVLSPTTGVITSSQFAGSNPDVLAISDDSSFLYAGIDGESIVQRFILPSLATDISYPLGSSTSFGPFFALDLQVAPGAPHTTAVTLAVFGSEPAAQGGITIFDDATARPTTAPGFGPGGGGSDLFDTLQWGSDATALFASNNEDTGFDFYTLSVNSSGVVLDHDFPNAFSGFNDRIHFDQGTTLIYSDDGHVLNQAGSPVGDFDFFGVMTPDSTLNAAFILGQTQDQIGSNTFTLQSFDLTHFTSVDSIVISNVNGNPSRLIRWGTNGLAFITFTGAVYLIQSPLVGPVGDAVHSLPNNDQRNSKAAPHLPRS